MSWLFHKLRNPRAVRKMEAPGNTASDSESLRNQSLDSNEPHNTALDIFSRKDFVLASAPLNGIDSTNVPAVGSQQSLDPDDILAPNGSVELAPLNGIDAADVPAVASQQSLDSNDNPAPNGIDTADVSAMGSPAPPNEGIDTADVLAVGSHLFAVVIGINRYKEAEKFGNLRGAEPDAQAFASYLQYDLKVPSAQIKILLNEEAKRHSILNSLEDLAIHPLIRQDDPIVIFFAGHGAEQEVQGWHGKKLQMIVPHDFSSGLEAVRPITDKELERVVGKIATKKGNNITVILDCCHSASGTRDTQLGSAASLTTVRSIKLDGSFNDAEHHQTTTRGVKIPQGETKVGSAPKSNSSFAAALQSHVLIAACSASEQAKETNGRGNFSVSLIKLLKKYSSPDNSSHLKYSDITTQMDAVAGQNPQCEGNNQHRPLFHSKIQVLHQRRFEASFEGSTIVTGGIPSSPFVVKKAGAANGITLGAQFDIYSTDDTVFQEPLVSGATVDSVDVFQATLRPRTPAPANSALAPDSAPAPDSASAAGGPPVPDSFPLDRNRKYVAILTNLGNKEDFCLWVPQSDSLKLNKIYKSVQSCKFNITLVSKLEDAHVKASAQDGDRVVFEVVDERATRHGFTGCKSPPLGVEDTAGLNSAFAGMAHFYRELNLVNSSNKPSIGNHISVKFLRLEELATGDFRPVESKETKQPTNLYANGIVDIVADNTPYGLELTNMTIHHLYPYVFLFDNTNLKIGCLYQSPSPGNTKYDTDAPLKANSSFTIGYGIDSGCDPLCFEIDNGTVTDVSFLKIILSTRPIDVDHIPQESPFEVSRGQGKYKRTTDAWDAIIIPIVQRL